VFRHTTTVTTMSKQAPTSDAVQALLELRDKLEKNGRFLTMVRRSFFSQRDHAPPAARRRRTLSSIALSLTRKPNENSKSKPQVRQSQQRAATQLRRAELTLEELSPLPECASVFRPLGRAYVAAGRAELSAELGAACSEARGEAAKLGVQAERAEAQMRATEDELRELVRSAPEAAAALMRMGGGGA